jgi:hypothetical protein
MTPSTLQIVIAGQSPTSAEISALRDGERIPEAWQTVNSLSLSNAVDEDVRAIWLDHVTGRRGDYYLNIKSLRQKAGCLLWDYARHVLHDAVKRQALRPKSSQQLRKLLDQLAASVNGWRDGAATIWGLHGPNLENFQSLVAAAAAVCRCAASAVIGADVVASNENHGRNAAVELARAVEAYYKFWTGKPLARAAAEEAFAWQASRSRTQRLFFKDVARQLEDLLAVAQAALVGQRPSDAALPIAFAMVRRAVRWLLLDDDRTDRRQSQLLVPLVAPKGEPTCAWLELGADDEPIGGQDTGPFAVYPDPISLGTLVLDDMWRRSFDDAVVSAKNEGAAGCWRWRLRYLDESAAAGISGRDAPLRNRMQRPLVQCGSSASAALALLLHARLGKLVVDERVGISAAVTPSGQLEPVQLLAKLKGSPHWEAYLCERLDALLACEEGHEERDRHAENAARSSLGRGKPFLRRVSTVGEAMAFLKKRRRTMLSRRVAWAVGLVLLAAAPAVGFWWSREPALPPIAPALNPTDVDLGIHFADRETRRSAPLRRSDLPLEPGDGVKFVVTSKKPMYYYLLWLDCNGSVTPLWPWSNLTWKVDARNDRPRTSLSFPAGNTHFKLQDDTSGLHSVILVARWNPLPATEDIKNLSWGDYAQTELSPFDQQTLVVFEDARLLDFDMRSPLSGATQDFDAPIAVLENLIQVGLMPQADTVDAMLLPFAGEKK